MSSNSHVKLNFKKDPFLKTLFKKPLKGRHARVRSFDGQDFHEILVPFELVSNFMLSYDANSNMHDGNCADLFLSYVTNDAIVFLLDIAYKRAEAIVNNTNTIFDRRLYVPYDWRKKII